MVRVRITGMSGTGKSSVIAALDTHGYRAVDADEGGYSHLVHIPDDEPTGLAPGTDWVWDEVHITALLNEPDDTHLFVGGCAPNHDRFCARLDHVILLVCTARTDGVAPSLTSHEPVWAAGRGCRPFAPDKDTDRAPLPCRSPRFWR